jgi:hypothetical protein
LVPYSTAICASLISGGDAGGSAHVESCAHVESSTHVESSAHVESCANAKNRSGSAKALRRERR